jgi:hypothetical protein
VSRSQPSRADHIPQRAAWYDGVKRIAGHKDKPIFSVRQVDRGRPGVDDLTVVHEVALRAARRRFKHNLVVLFQPLQELEMGVAMASEDRGARRSWKRTRFCIARAEGQCAAVSSIQYDQINPL